MLNNPLVNLITNYVQEKALHLLNILLLLILLFKIKTVYF